MKAVLNSFIIPPVRELPNRYFRVVASGDLGLAIPSQESPEKPITAHPASIDHLISTEPPPQNENGIKLAGAR
jgi:hypothetical protein